MSRDIVFAVTVACAAPASAEAQYFSDVPDLPMPPGFTEHGADARFDGVGGRLLILAAEGDMPVQAVRDFYYECLPQLGWAISPQTDETLVFQRGRERLTIAATRENDHLLLSVQLVVSQAASD